MRAVSLVRWETYTFHHLELRRLLETEFRSAHDLRDRSKGGSNRAPSISADCVKVRLASRTGCKVDMTFLSVTPSDGVG